MEQIYLKPEAQHVFCTENLYLNDYFHSFEDAVKLPYENESFFSYLRRRTVDDNYEDALLLAIIKYIEAQLSIRKDKSKIIPKDKFRSDFNSYSIPVEADGKVVGLKTLKYLNQRDPNLKPYIKKKLKYIGETDLERGQLPDEERTEYQILPYNDYILTARIYLPTIHSKFAPWSRSRLAVSEELFLMSTQPLIDLRDKIACNNDFKSLEGNVCGDPFGPPMLLAKNKYKSSMFYIGNNFYVDDRDENNIDYTAPLRAWATRKKIELGSVCSMLTNFNSIVFRLGYPYLYQHLGDCEHLIIFTDAKLLHAYDDCKPKHYPILKSYSYLKGKYCMICTSKIAAYVVQGSVRLLSDSTYLCRTCLLLYCYKGSFPLEDFKVFHYRDRTFLF